MDSFAAAEDVTAQASETAQAGAQAGAQAFKEQIGQATAAGNQAFKDTMEKSVTALNDLNAQAKRNLEALVASMTSATRGAEALGAQAMEYTKRTVDGHVEQAKALAAARSVQEIIELQTTFAKSAMEAYIAELNRASETLSNAVKDSFRPLNERASSMVETFQATR